MKKNYRFWLVVVAILILAVIYLAYTGVVKLPVSRGLAALGIANSAECSFIADTNKDCKIDAMEMADAAKALQAKSITMNQFSRTAQFYKTRGYKVQAGTEDGFAPLPALQYHQADLDKNYKIEKNEIDAYKTLYDSGKITFANFTRVTQLYNSACGYKVQAGTEDGFATKPCEAVVISKSYLNPSAQTVYANEGVSASEKGKIPLLIFNLRASGEKLVVSEISARIEKSASSGAKPTKAYLYAGSTLIGSVPVIINKEGRVATAYFKGLNRPISANMTQTFTLKVDVANANESPASLVAFISGRNIKIKNQAGVSVVPLGTVTSNAISVMKGGL